VASPAFTGLMVLVACVGDDVFTLSVSPASVPVWTIIVGGGILLSNAFFFLTTGTAAPASWLQNVFAFLAFSAAIVWLDILAGETVPVTALKSPTHALRAS
jgi:hypothetical protein